MSSRSRSSSALLVLALLATVAGCQREKREYDQVDAPDARRADTVRTGELQPGKPIHSVNAVRGAHFEGNAFHVNQGAKLYKWFNCNGCHGAGGGSIGPALMDGEWRYGGRIEQIHATIAHGRPNGMPAFAGKIPDDQIWQIAAYVRTLSGNAPKYVAGGARQGMSVGKPPAMQDKRPPKTSEPSQ